MFRSVLIPWLNSVLWMLEIIAVYRMGGEDIGWVRSSCLWQCGGSNNNLCDRDTIRSKCWAHSHTQNREGVMSWQRPRASFTITPCYKRNIERRGTATILISHLEQILFHLLTLLKLILHPYRGIGSFQSRDVAKREWGTTIRSFTRIFFSRVHVKWCAFIDDLCLYGSMMN